MSELSTAPDLFTAPDLHWKPLSPNYARLKRLMVWLTWPVFFAVIALPAFFWYWWAAVVVAVVGLAWTTYRWSRQRRIADSWGYCERETDLYIRHGLWERTMTVVPYGRMQVVTMNSGPIEQRYGLATVHLETASAGTNASIPGLPTAEAERLRDRLSELGEQQAVGL